MGIFTTSTDNIEEEVKKKFTPNPQYGDHSVQEILDTIIIGDPMYPESEMWMHKLVATHRLCKKFNLEVMEAHQIVNNFWHDYEDWETKYNHELF